MFMETIREQMAKTIQYVKPVPYGSATGLTAEVYEQMQADFMPAPLIVLHSPMPKVMAGVWSMLRETLLAGQARARKEAVAATVSKINECPYCVEAHTVMLHATSDHDLAGALLRGDYGSIHDPDLYSLVQWLLANRTPGTNGVLPPPFSYSDAPEMIGTAVAFHYINRMVNVFLGDTLLPVPPALKGLTHRLYAATAGQKIVRYLPQGDSLKFVPQTKLPDDFFWAAANPAVTGAFAGLAEVVEEAGKEVLPEKVRSLVSKCIQAWHGEEMGISRRWVEESVAALNDEHRPAARLALLTALASYQVDAGIIEDFQSQYLDDASLIAATAWASFTVARHVGVRLGEPLMVAGRG
jgi:AhpD family alkylhydroperoxidase